MTTQAQNIKHTNTPRHISQQHKNMKMHETKLKHDNTQITTTTRITKHTNTAISESHQQMNHDSK